MLVRDSYKNKVDIRLFAAENDGSCEEIEDVKFVGDWDVIGGSITKKSFTIHCNGILRLIKLLSNKLFLLFYGQIIFAIEEYQHSTYRQMRGMNDSITSNSDEIKQLRKEIEELKYRLALLEK